MALAIRTPRRLAAAAVACASFAACAGPGRGGRPREDAAAVFASARMHHLLDLEDARGPLRELEPFLRDADPDVRTRAALAVARTGGDEAPNFLRAAAVDGDPGVLAAAALGMGLSDDPGLARDALDLARRRPIPGAASAAVRLAGKEAVDPPFADLFAAKEPPARRAAFRALVGAIRGWKEKPPAPPFLAEALGDADPEVRQAAALALRSLKHGEDADAALARLVGSDPDPDVRASAALAVAPAFPGHEAALVEALGREPVARVRASTCRGLGGAKGPDSLRALLLSLRDPDFAVRGAAADFLGQRLAAAPRRDPGAEEALAAVAVRDPATFARVAAADSLHLLDSDLARRTVAALSRDRNPFVRAAAAGTSLPMEDLGRLARDPEVRVREAAVQAAGARGRTALGLCLEVLEDRDPVVAGIAATALGEMGAAEAALRLEAALRRAAAPAVAPDDAGDLRAAALEALGKIGAASAPALARAHLGDPDPLVRAAASGILEGPDGKKPGLPVPPRLLPFVDRAELRVRSAGAPRVRFDTDRGTFLVETDPEAAPVHVARLLARVRAGGYDGTIFHRVVPNFVVQGGDPRGDGSGSGGAPTRQEFSDRFYRRGTLGVPRNSPPDSGGCQLFFCIGSTPHLDQRYTVMGRIVEGFEVLDRIDLGDRILRARVE